MFSGGEMTITYKRYEDQKQVVEGAEVKGDKVAQENELIFLKDGKEISGDKLTNDTLVTVDGKKIPFGAFKQAALTKNEKTIAALKPAEMLKAYAEGQKEVAKAKQKKATSVHENIEKIKKAIKEGAAEVTVKTLDGSDSEPVVKKDFQTALTARFDKLNNLMTQIQKANIAAGLKPDNGIRSEWKRAVKETAEKGTGDKNSASSFMYQMAGPGSGVKAAGSYYGATPNGATPAMFQSMPEFTPSSYAAGLYVDSTISDGIGQLGKSRSEGQKLMLLFMYFARMAMSGDLGAMYQLIQFINYIIAKDKARQNIQISSKLIQLQDLSRKATETLMSTPTEGKSDKEINEFTKALHKAKSQESTISTSQKLLADMLQEFAHVTEAMTNSSKFLLDAWGRVMRTATRA